MGRKRRINVEYTKNWALKAMVENETAIKLIQI